MLKFENIIARKPCKAMLEGISTGMFSDDKPVYEKAVDQHQEYVETIESLGVKALVLDALEEYRAIEGQHELPKEYDHSNAVEANHCFGRIPRLMLC